jgi:hypothetical protein
MDAELLIPQPRHVAEIFRKAGIELADPEKLWRELSAAGWVVLCNLSDAELRVWAERGEGRQCRQE